MSEKFLYLFPGAHKTATTLLQASLEVNRATLLEEGVSIVKRQRFYKSGLHPKLQTANAVAALKPEERNELIEHVLGSPLTDKVVMSIENIFGEISPKPYRNAEKVLNNLKVLFPEHEIRVWFYTRRQDTFVESAFIQEYHTGLDVDPVAYTQKFIDQPLDWVWPVKTMAKVVGRKNVRIIPYESIKNGLGRYLANFYRTFTKHDPKEMIARFKNEQPFTNVSLSAKGLDILKATFDVVTDKKERRQIATLLQSGFGADKFPRYRLPEDRLELLRKAHVELNAKLVRRVRFPPNIEKYYMFEEPAETSAEVEREKPAVVADVP